MLCSAEKWHFDVSTGKTKKRALALKVVPCSTEQQRALLEREAANLRSLVREEGRHNSPTFAPLYLDHFTDVQSGQGILAMRSALPLLPCARATCNGPDEIYCRLAFSFKGILAWQRGH